MTANQDMKRRRNAAIVNMAKWGCTPKAIAATFHLHVTGVHRILRNNGAGRRESGKPEKPEQVQSIPAQSVIRSQ